MSNTAAGSASLPSDRAIESSVAAFLLILASITLLRVAGLWLSQVDLDVDEAQYWTWSRELAWGYFSKPPLIAAINAANGYLCGDSIPCIRLPAPLFYFGTSLLVYATARELYGARAAFWSGLGAALAIGISFSARLMTTDVPLLFFTALWLFAYVRLYRGGGWGAALLLGAAFGLGLLAKVAMAYVVAGAVLAGLIDGGKARALLRNPRLWAGLAIGALIFAPNVVWNIQNGWPSARSISTNVASGGGFNLLAPIGFLASQFAVAGPVVFGALLALYVRLFGGRLESAHRMLIGFTIPALAVVTANALAGGSNANWAAIALIPAFVVTGAVLVREGRRGLLVAGALIGAFAQLVLVCADAYADRINIPLMARGDIYRRVLGWEELGTKVRAIDSASIAAVDYGDVAELRYYLRDDPRPLYAFPADGPAKNHFQLTRPLTPQAPEPILAILRCRDPGLERSYRSVERLGEIRVSTGPTSSRSYFAFRVASPLERVPALGTCR